MPANSEKTKAQLLDELQELRDRVGKLESIVTEHRQTEEALRESEEHFRLLSEQSVMGTVILQDNVFKYVNQATADISEYSIDEMMSWPPKTYLNIFHPDDAAFVAEQARRKQTGEEGIVVHYECRTITQTGKVKWVTVYSKPVLFDGRSADLITMSEVTARRQAEQDYRTLFSEMLDGFALHEIICDDRGNPVDYRFLAVNPAFERITGLKAQDITAKTVLEVLPGIEPHSIETYGKVALTGEPAFFENYSQELDKHFQVTAYRPSPRELACIFADITERKHADEALRESEERYRLLADNVKDVIWTMDMSLRFTYLSPAVEEMFGFAADELLNRPLDKLLSVDALNVFGETLQQELAVEGQGGDTHAPSMAVEVTIRRKDGSWVPVEIVRTVIRDNDGTPRQILGVTRDITERKRAEEALHESQQQLHSVIGAMPIVLWAIDKEGEFLVSEGQGLEALGLKPGEVVGLSIFEAYKEYPEAMASIQRGLAGEEAFADVEVAGRVWGNRYMPQRDEHGEVVGLAATSLDVTDQRKAEDERTQLEEQMRQTQKLESLGVMAGGIAHDFNNILFAILGNADLALEEMPLEAVGRSFLSEIQTAARRASGLTNQMLAYSGKGALAIEKMDLSALVREMAHLLEVSHTKKAILKYRFEEGLSAIEGDASQLRQVVMNLITNASEAIGDEGGIITVETGVTEASQEYLATTYAHDELPGGPYVYLEVTDTGCGMDEEAQRRIFEPFFTTKLTGRGLGMAAVLGIVRAHKGAIDIQSEVNRGTTVKALFPALDGPVGPSAEKAPQEEDWNARGTVLVVDDEPQIRNLLKIVLERKGFTVLTAEDGRKATEIFDEHKDDIVCVLLDLTMPHMSGEETFIQLRQIRPDVPTVLLSGYSEKQLKERVEDLDFAGFLKKPIGSREILDKVRTALEFT